MANENQFEVIIGGDGKELSKTLSELQADFRTFQKQLADAKGGTAIADINKRLQETKASINAIKSFRVDTGSFENGIKKSNLAVHEFNQVLRELPAFTYSAQTGVLALSNNLPMLADRIKEMRGAGASFGSILGTLGKSLLSFPSILTIAIGAFTIFGDRIFGASKKVKEGKSAIDAYQKRLNDAVGDIAKEAANIQVLVSRLQSGNIARSETVAIIDKLKAAAPDYFSKLDSEKSKIEDVVRAYTNYNNQLVKSIETQLRMSELMDAVKQRLEFETNFPEASKQFNEMLASGKSLEQISATISAQFTEQNKQTAQLALSEKGRYATNKDFATGNNLLIGQLQTILSLRRKEESVLSHLKQETVRGKEDAKTQVDSIKAQVEQWERLRKEVGLTYLEERQLKDLKIAINNIDPTLSAGAKERLNNHLQAEFEDLYRTRFIEIKAPIKIQRIAKPISPAEALGGPIAPNYDPIIQRIAADADTDKAQANLQIIRERLLQIGDTAVNFLQPAFSALFDDLVSGSQSAGQAFSRFFKDLIKQLISTVAQAAALAAIMSAITGGAANGGKSFGGAFGQLLGLGESFFGSGNRGNVAFGRGGGGGGLLQSIVRGADLLLIGSRSQTRNNRTGGTPP